VKKWSQTWRRFLAHPVYDI